MYHSKLVRELKKLDRTQQKTILDSLEANTSHCIWYKSELITLGEYFFSLDKITPKNVEKKLSFKKLFKREDYSARKLEDVLSCFHELMRIALHK